MAVAGGGGSHAGSRRTDLGRQHPHIHRVAFFVLAADHGSVGRNQQLLTTGQVAQILGCSRQHVVDLCDSGKLPCSVIGSHRRVARHDVQAFMVEGRVLRREEERSLWLHRALLGPLMRDPDRVFAQARSNLERWSASHRSDGMSQSYLREWERLLDQGVDAVADVLTGRNPHSVELRANSPFAGVVDEQERLAVHRSFHRHWAAEHPAA